MNTKLIHTVLILSLAVASMAAEPQHSPATTASQRLRILTERHMHLEALFAIPERKGTQIPLSDVPDAVRKYAAEWVRRVIKPGRLPANFETTFTAIKDARLRELRDSKGKLWDHTTGDFLILSYKTDGAEVELLESGYGITIKVVLPKALSATVPMDQVFADFWGGWINGPPLSVAGFTIAEAPPLHHASVKDRTPLFTDGRPQVASWWEYVEMWTDRKAFYVVIHQLETGRTNLKRSSGLPDRF